MAGITTNSVPATFAPNVTTLEAQTVTPDALIHQITTKAGEVEGDDVAITVAYVDDDTATSTAEYAAIAENNPTLDETAIYTEKITTLMNVSNEQYRQSLTASTLSQSAQRSIVKKADNDLLNNTDSTVSTWPTGLLSTTGMSDGGNITTSLDPLIDLVADLESVGAVPSHILIDPQGWAALRKLRTGDGSNLSILGAGTVDAARILLGIPVIVSNAMPQHTGLVIDKTAILSAIGPVRAAVSEHEKFSQDAVTMRVTWRIGWGLVRPERIGKFAIGEPTGPAA